MLSFLQQPSIPPLPEGTRLETSTPPTSQQLNTLLMSCGESTHPEERWELALQRSLWQISILEESTGELIGFVRATSDLALNANLWNLAAKPGPNQGALLPFWCTVPCRFCAGICPAAASRSRPLQLPWRHSNSKVS